MKIELKNIKVCDVFNGYDDKGDDGVFAYGGKLSIRPPYQREYVYSDEQAESVVQTTIKGYPLNVMYWAKTGDDSFEVMDGQQRTLSLMKFLSHQFQIHMDGKSFYHDALPNDVYDAIMSYELMIYVCDGTESEKLAWFTTVNIAGEKLTNQELRNISYTGPWLSDAKFHFSKRTCAAKHLSDRYIIGDPNRQELLEKALKGICEYQGMKDVTDYMAAHKSDQDADELWQYFQDVVHWIEKIFPTYYKDMQGLDWCHLYNKYSKNSYNSTQIDKDVANLHLDKEVQKKKGIYEFLLSRDSDPFAGRLLNLRTFDDDEKAFAYEKQNHLCAVCHQHFKITEMEGDHILPWSKGGKTVVENLQMLCKHCNSIKSDKY